MIQQNDDLQGKFPVFLHAFSMRFFDTPQMLVICFSKMTLVALPSEGSCRYTAVVIMDSKVVARGLSLWIDLRATGFTLTYSDKKGRNVINGHLIKDGEYRGQLEVLPLEVSE